METRERRITRHGLRKAEAKARRAGRHPIGAGLEYLALARQAGTIRTTQYLGRLFDSAGEHDVELSHDGRRVVKHTHLGKFGWHVGLDENGLIDFTPGTAGQYMDHMKVHNQAFSTDFHLEGSLGLANGGFTYSQTHFPGPEPEGQKGMQEIGDYMRSKEFVRVNNTVLGHNAKYTTWFHPGKRFIATDIKPSNFRRAGVAGALHPIDLIVRRVRAGTRLHGAVLQGVSQ